ncbi:uncharacterized protein [Neodiprion pinetum]|uniref:uncharacterized protein n=1 Tax=Neodiprion pinetum TaxID=441929 RepID=UPI001EDFD603|nr:uncharacterized protein LOC124213642 [Neodiprion pinetum]
MPEILKVLLILSCFIVMTASEGIMCYKCTPTKEFNSQRSLACSQFDRSQRFKVYCPKSTFCMNKTYSVPLLHGEIETLSGTALHREKYLTTGMIRNGIVKNE